MKYIIRKLIVCFMIFIIMSSVSFAATGNDGSAFITKTEFDTLKSSFLIEINDYFNGIDSKITDAIAEYLSGIKTRSETSGVLNNISNDGYYFTKGWDIPTPTLGSASKSYFSVMRMRENVGTANTLTEIQLQTGQRNIPSWNEKNLDDPANYLYGSKNSDGSFTCTQLLKTILKSSLVGFATGGDSSYANNGDASAPTNKFTKGTSTRQGVYSDTWYIGSTGGGSWYGNSLSINVSKSFLFEDTYQAFDIKNVPGSALPTDEYYFVDDKKINDLGTKRDEYHPTYYGYRNWRVDSTSGNTLVENSSADWINNNLIEGYNHSYESMHLTDIINVRATNILGENVYYYNGLPIIKCQSDTDLLEIELLITNTDNKTTSMIVKKGRFGNESIEQNSGIGPTAICAIGTTYKVASGVKVKYEISNVQAGDIIFVKAIPNTDDSKSKITVESIYITR